MFDAQATKQVDVSLRYRVNIRMPLHRLSNIGSSQEVKHREWGPVRPVCRVRFVTSFDTY